MTISLALLKSLDKLVSPFIARQLFLTNHPDNPFYENKDAFQFECETDGCDAVIVGALIFQEEQAFNKKKKKCAHFRSKNKDDHASCCPHGVTDSILKKPKNYHPKSEDSVNGADAPTELLLHPRQKKSPDRIRLHSKPSIVESIVDGEEIEVLQYPSDNKPRRVVMRTTSLYPVAEKWMSMSINERRDAKFKLGSRVGNYSNCFNSIGFFKQNSTGMDIILHGEISKAWFRGHDVYLNFDANKAFYFDRENKTKYPIQLHITPEVLEGSYKKNSIIKTWESICNQGDPVQAFIVPSNIHGKMVKNGRGQDVIEFEIYSIDHCALIIVNDDPD